MTQINAKYVDGFVFTVPKKNLEAYRKMIKEAKKVWMSYGALDYKECMGEDLAPKKEKGMPTPLSFTKLTNAGKNDTVWFSFITYKNRKHRDAVNKKVMEFFSKKYEGKEDMSMPFDMEKMCVGGFAVEA
jgi:uncharacterized protein YbaA (DUF1428 family)